MHLVNSQAADSLSLLDRGLLYGHSAFETLLVHARQPLLLEAHIARLQHACGQLDLPLDLTALRQDIEQLCADYSDSSMVLRIMQTVGEGGRGYLSPERSSGNRIVSAFAAPNHSVNYQQDGIVLGLASLQLSAQPRLAGLKHSNRIEQILARKQWEPSWQEALVTDIDGNVIEATQSNVFIVCDGALKTPDLSQCGVAGVMRGAVLDAAKALGLKAEIMPLSLHDVTTADGVFVTNSVIGLWPVKRFNGSTDTNTTNITTYAPLGVVDSLINQLKQDAAIPPN